MSNKFLLSFALVLLYCGLLTACQTQTQTVAQQPVAEFVRSALPSNPVGWKNSLTPKVAESYHSAMSQALTEQFANCENCAFSIDHLNLNRVDSTWQVEMVGKMKRSGQEQSFNKMLTITETPSAKPQFVIQSIRDVEG